MVSLARPLPTTSRSSTSRLRRRTGRVVLEARLRVREAGPRLRRAIDITAATLALVVLAPFIPLLVLAIRLDSRGPVLFRQIRVGRDGHTFSLLKLRTMVHGAEAMKAALAQAAGASSGGVRFKMKRDPRITRVGRWLRKLSIDELPQLWNVLRGDMTLIGPRPPLPREVVLYDSRALRRLSVTPGLTCLWQIGGRSDLTFSEQVDLDLEYVDRVRPLQEVGILLRTIPAVVTGRGAY